MSAGVVQQQDSRATSQQMAVQLRPSRSNTVRSLRVEQVSARVVTNMITHKHYLRSMPTAACACFAVYIDTELHGAVVFASGARHSHRLIVAGQPQQVVTLARLWLSDDCPKNSESRVLGIVLRHLKREGRWKFILSYADPSAGHVGTIYQATGWLYLGQGASSSYLDLGDGQLVHPRSAYEQLGSNAVRHLRRTGIAAIRRNMPGKYRYVYLLEPTWRWRMTAESFPYPHRQPVSTTATES